MITKDTEAMMKKFLSLPFFDLEELKNTIKPEMEKLFDDIKTDSNGNLHFCKKGNGKKIQIIFRCDPAGVLIESQKDNRCAIQLVGKKKAEAYINHTLYDKETPIGILRSEEKEKVYLETFSDYTAEIMEIFNFKNQSFCKGDSLYGNNLGFAIALFFAYLIGCEIKEDEKYINFTVWNASLSGESGALEACKAFSPDSMIVFSGIESQDGCKFGEGPTFVVKDGSFVASKATREIVKTLDVPLQSFLGKTDRIMEQLSIADTCKNVFGFYFPILHEKTPIEKINLVDMEKLETLLLKIMMCL